MIKSRAKEVRECGQEIEKNQSSGKNEDDRTITKNMNGSEKSDVESSTVKVQFLAVMLLVEFVDSLEKAMFNASDGCAVAVPPSNKVQYMLIF